jgi:hypothetical protein
MTMLIIAFSIDLLFYSKNLAFYFPYVPGTIKLIIVFGYSMITYSYICSFLFSTSTSAFKTFPIVNFIVGYSAPQVIFESFLPNSNLETLWECLSPFYTLQQSIKALTSSPGGIIDPNYYLYFMFGQGTIFFLVAIWYDKRYICFKNRIV